MRSARCGRRCRRGDLPGAECRLTISIVVSAILPLAAQTKTTEKTETTEHPDGSVTEKTTTKTRTVRARGREARGLPPTIVMRVKVKEVPAAWRTTRIGTGAVIQEKERVHLIDAPPELEKVLPPPTPNIRYYVAGSNVVAVDRDFRVVDSVHIPSIKIVADVD